MSHQEGLWQWVAEVSRHLPGLSRRQGMVLALFSYGMVMTRRSGLSSVAHFLAELLGKRFNSLRQCLREWCYDAPDKRGRQRQEVEVTGHFVFLLKWVLSWWASGERQLALALDATTLGQRFTVLAMSVLYRGCALPVAWAIVPTTAKGAWQPHWLGLLALLAPAVPKPWRVLVLTDRGLYAKWLFDAIKQQGWHPFMRINGQGQYRFQRGKTWRALKTVVAQTGFVWARRVVCFKTPDSQLPCILLACWQQGYQDAWLVVTDLPVSQACIAWYGLRSWIEAGFKDFKRGGWRWEQTKMTRPERAERLWFVMAVATLWVLSVGGQADAALAASSLPALPKSRPLSCFVLGLNRILAAVIRHLPLPFGCFIPDDWPKAPL